MFVTCRNPKLKFIKPLGNICITISYGPGNKIFLCKGEKMEETSSIIVSFNIYRETRIVKSLQAKSLHCFINNYEFPKRYVVFGIVKKVLFVLISLHAQHKYTYQVYVSICNVKLRVFNTKKT